MTSEPIVKVEGRELKLTNLDKVLWPDIGITKAEVIKYYAEVGRYMVAFIRDRPIMVQRYPHGIRGEFFVQKHFPATPSWIKTFNLKGEHVLCNDLPTLVWLANQAAIEINHMLSRAPQFTQHDLILIDLDPHRPATFAEARVVARGMAVLLQRMGLRFLAKTSGADGIHFLIPIRPRYSIEQIRRFIYALGKLVEKADPGLATVSTRRDRKRGRVYIDFLQNGLEKTITAPLSLRALPGAPVSYPLSLKQLGNSRLKPTAFTLRKVPRKSDVLSRMLRLGRLQQELGPAFEKLGVK